ncbi:MAG: hypothetical protein ACI915_001292 [Gammaproteobacteria bacterium]|jgi:hypothetical protein
MSHYKLTAEDEKTHQPTDSINFNESVYVNGFEPERRFGGWMRMGNRINEGHAEAQVCLYLPDGRIACQFQRPDISHNDGFAAGGMRYEVHEPLKKVSMHFEGELMVLDDPNLLRDPKKLFTQAERLPGKASFKLTGVSPVHGGEPLTDSQETMYGRDFSFGHFFQHTRTVAHFEVGGEKWDLDSFGWRDHSWGPRYWTNIYFYRLLIANFGPDRSMMLLKITGRDGVTRRHGVLQIDDQYEEITDMDIITEWTAEKDPKTIHLGVRTAQRNALMEGRVIQLAPLSNRRKVGDEVLKSRIAEGLTEWTWDGLKGIGVTEYIEFLENGEPVGYPL